MPNNRLLELVNAFASGKLHDVRSIIDDFLHRVIGGENDPDRGLLLGWLFANNRYLALKNKITREHVLATIGHVTEEMDLTESTDDFGCTPFHYFLLLGAHHFKEDDATLEKIIFKNLAKVNLNTAIEEKSFYEGVTVGCIMLTNNQKTKQILFKYLNDYPNVFVDLNVSPRCKENSFYSLNIVHMLVIQKDYQTISQLITCQPNAWVDLNSRFQGLFALSLFEMLVSHKQWEIIDTLISREPLQYIDLQKSYMDLHESRSCEQAMMSASRSDLIEKIKANNLRLALEHAQQETRGMESGGLIPPQETRSIAFSDYKAPEEQELFVQLINAIKSGSIEDVRIAISAGANPHSWNRDKTFRPVDVAAKHGHLHIIQCLVKEYKVRLDASGSGKSPSNFLFYMMSCTGIGGYAKQYQILEWLLDKDRYKNIKNNVTKLHVLAAIGKVTDQNDLTAHLDNIGHTPFHYFLTRGANYFKEDDLTLKKIIYNNLDKIDFNTSSEAILMTISANSIQKVRQIFMDYLRDHPNTSINLNSKLNGETILHRLALQDDFELIEMLIEHQSNAWVDLNSQQPGAYRPPSFLIYWFKISNGKLLRLLSVESRYNILI